MSVYLTDDSLLRDQETGLPNKELILDRLRMSMALSHRYQMSMAVCFLRIFSPEELADADNQDVITQLKQAIAERLKKCVREIDSIGVVTETDFIVLLTDVSELECSTIVKRIIDLVSGPYTLWQRNINVNVSVGICLYPYHGDTVEKLLNLSKAEMFHALETGINHFSISNVNSGDPAYRKALIENDLSYAIRDKQIKVVYQPQLQINTLTVLGVEALIRWNHPTIGYISPDEFIPIAEQNGFSTKLFFWLFEEICREVKQKGDHFLSELKISINVSINQVLIPDFEERVCTISDKYGMKYEQFLFEITENIKLYKHEIIKEKLNALRKNGFMVAIDDFGCGFFSFSDLIYLPIDIIKFDKQFVRNLIKNNKLKSVISPLIEMAHNLGLKIIVEGVEDIEQFNEWKNLNCDIIQGFLLSQPVEFSLLEETIKGVHSSFRNPF